MTSALVFEMHGRMELYFTIFFTYPKIETQP